MTARRGATRGVPGEAVHAPERLPASILGRQTLIVPDFPSTDIARALSPNGRVHWAAKSRARESVAWVVSVVVRRRGIRRVDGPVRLIFRYVFPDQRKRDIDNLTTGVTKAAIDALVRNKVLAADDSEHVTEVKAEAVVEKGARRMEIVIEPAPCPATSGASGVEGE